MTAMSDQSAIDQAVKRLALALDSLDAAVERRRQSDRSEEVLANQVHALGVDRTRLAEALDGLDAAMASIQAVLDANE
jgi:uncharacterized protein DUF4164